jgi:hypothetical protein
MKEAFSHYRSKERYVYIRICSFWSATNVLTLMWNDETDASHFITQEMKIHPKLFSAL